MTTGARSGIPRTRSHAIQARLAGRSIDIDPRVSPLRPDLAAIDLAGTVMSSYYAAGEHRVCKHDRTMVRSDGDDRATATSELLFGESFTVFDVAGGWSWGQCSRDLYVGWVSTAALSSAHPCPSHRVIAPSAPVFAGADIKTTVLRSLPLNSLIDAGGSSGTFVAAADGWVHSRHVAAIGSALAEPAVVAARFVGVPYVWGGRTHYGIDCSGLTQAALLACGIECPRDSDQQYAALNSAIAVDERRRGDLVFFPGHVGILDDPQTVIHANAFWMETVVEPLDAVIARVPLTGIARPRRA